MGMGRGMTFGWDMRGAVLERELANHVMCEGVNIGWNGQYWIK